MPLTANHEDQRRQSSGIRAPQGEACWTSNRIETCEGNVRWLQTYIDIMAAG